MVLSLSLSVSAVKMTEDGEYIFTDSRGNEVIVPKNAFATRVVSFEPGNPWSDRGDKRDPNDILGAPVDETEKRTRICAWDTAA